MFAPSWYLKGTVAAILQFFGSELLKYSPKNPFSYMKLLSERRKVNIKGLIRRDFHLQLYIVNTSFCALVGKLLTKTELFIFLRMFLAIQSNTKNKVSNDDYRKKQEGRSQSPAETAYICQCSKYLVSVVISVITKGK